MTIDLESFLGLNGPSTSARLLRTLEEAGATPEAARKRLQRLAPTVHRLKDAGLGKKQQLFYLPGDYCSDRYFEALEQAWREAGAPHANALSVLDAAAGWMYKHLLEVRLGAPTAMKKQVALDRVLEQLESHRFIKTIEVAGKPAIARSSTGEPRAERVARVRAVHVAEQVALEALKDWARKNSFVSYEKVALRGDASRPSFANFFFDLVGPSYLRPLAGQAADKMQPGFVVADMWLDVELTLSHVQGFVRKTRMIRSLKNSRPFFAFLLADRFAPDAFQFGKQQGVVFTTPENIFGIQIARALAQLITTITDAATAGHSNPDVVSDLMESLGRIEGAALNLRGPLFELIVAYVLPTIEGGSIQVGRTITGDNGKRAEVDVISTHADRMRACECKGHSPGHVVGVDVVKKWLEERVPVWRSWLLQTDGRDKALSVEFWTTGTFAAEATAYLRERVASTNKYQIRWFDGDAVLEQIGRTKTPRLAETLREHYLRHPLTVLE